MQKVYTHNNNESNKNNNKNRQCLPTLLQFIILFVCCSVHAIFTMVIWVWWIDGVSIARRIYTAIIVNNTQELTTHELQTEREKRA